MERPAQSWTCILHNFLLSYTKVTQGENTRGMRATYRIYDANVSRSSAGNMSHRKGFWDALRLGETFASGSGENSGLVSIARVERGVAENHCDRHHSR